MAKTIKIEFDEKALFKDLLAGDVKKSLDTCNMIIDRLEAIKAQLYQKSIPGYHFMTHVIPCEWECEQSPIGTCVYNHMKDQVHDDCIFCHYPDQRK